MKKKFWEGAAILALAAVVLAGCPSLYEGDAEAKAANGTVSGFVSLGRDVTDVDFTLVTVQLLQGGEAVGSPVQAAKNGVFSVANVPGGGGYVALATVESPLIKGGLGYAGASPVFAVNGGASDVETVLETVKPQTISGVISGGNGTVANNTNNAASQGNRQDQDLSRAEIQLWQGAALVKTVHPQWANSYYEGRAGVYAAAYSFTDVPQGYGYQIKAALESKKYPGLMLRYWESAAFNVLNITSAVPGATGGYQTVVFADNTGTFDGELAEAAKTYQVTGTVLPPDGGLPANRTLANVTVELLYNGVVPLESTVNASTDGTFTFDPVLEGGGFQVLASLADATNTNHQYQDFVPYYAVSDIFSVTGDVAGLEIKLRNDALAVESITVNPGQNQARLIFSHPVTVSDPAKFTVNTGSVISAAKSAANSTGLASADKIWNLTLGRTVKRGETVTLSYNADGNSVEYYAALSDNGANAWGSDRYLHLTALNNTPVTVREAEPFEVTKVYNRAGYGYMYIDMGGPVLPGLLMGAGTESPAGLSIYYWNMNWDTMQGEWLPMGFASINFQAGNAAGYQQQTGATNGAYRISIEWPGGNDKSWDTMRLKYDANAGNLVRIDGAPLKSFDLVSLKYWHTPW